MSVADNKSDVLQALRPVKSELRCAGCGYGIVASDAPEECPMCRSKEWEPVLWRPFSRRSDFHPREAMTTRAD